MARLVRLTPVGSHGEREDPKVVNLDHVLWMEVHRDGTLLLMDEPDGEDHHGAIIKSSILVAESQREILWRVMDEDPLLN